MLITLVVVGSLTAALALYVAAEFAAVSVRKSRVQQRADDGSALARQLLRVLDDPHRLDDYIAACQVGITIASLVAGAVAQAVLAPILAPMFERFGAVGDAAAETAAAAVVLIALTAIQMILGELVPKSIALQKPTQTALITVLPVQWSLHGMRLFIRLLNGSGAAILRLFGFAAAGHQHIHSPEEIEFLIAESARGGVLKPNEHIRLSHAVQLGRRAARTLMTPRTEIEAVDVNATFDEAVRLAVDSPYTRLPVFEDSIDQIVGMLHVRSLVQATNTPGDRPTIRDLMRPVLVLPDGLPADRVLTQLKEQHRTMAILVDEFGGTAGLITIDNILDNLIGDIADEFRDRAPSAERLADGRVRLPGGMHIDDAASWTRARWQSRFATVGGLVMAALGHVPHPGERVTIGGVVIEVETVEGRSVRSVLVTPARRDEGDAVRHG
jgi:CBS domain containing-hemolysin-like protein